jgi:hypothetical protein
VTDADMPRVDGVELCKFVKTQRPGVPCHWHERRPVRPEKNGKCRCRHLSSKAFWTG